MSNIEEAIAPASSYQHALDEVLTLQDRHYAVHGKLMMFALIIIFCTFFLFLTLIPCLRRLRDRKHKHQPEFGIPFPSENCPLFILKREKDNTDASSQAQQLPKDQTGRLLYF